MAVRTLTPKQPDETDTQYAKRAEAFWKAVEKDGESLKEMRERWG